MENIIGSSKEIQGVVEGINTVLKYNLPVFISGETGTGKELVAKALHYGGPRKEEKFCAISSGCVSESLLESELFGHVIGAFTGAISNHEGIFQFADRGTVFLDEIGCMSTMMQMKLLRVLEEKNFKRVGSNVDISTNARIISASNVDLEKEVFKKTFREDLYHRLIVFPIHVPPLRKRKEDIPELCIYFLKKFCDSNDLKEKEIDSRAMQLLMDYHWPGNIRELKNSLERAALLSNGSGILQKHFRFVDNKRSNEKSSMDGVLNALDKGTPFRLEQVEKIYISLILKSCKGCITKTAATLGINERTLRGRLKKFNIIYKP